MFKKFIAGLLTVVMVFSIVSISMPIEQVYAFDNFNVEVIKDSAPVREGYYETEKAIKWVKKGTILTVVGRKLNKKLNIWYKVKDGGYIFSGNVKKAHDHKVVFDKYGAQHPHYAEYKCKHCLNGAYCSNETTKVKSCEKCYPKNSATSNGTSSQKANTNKVPNTNVTTKSDILVPPYDSLQEEAEKKLQTPVHEHNYKFSEYSTTHPHYAIYKCSCGDSYQDTNKSQKITGCNTCYPPHQHDYKFGGYYEGHPHYASYTCSCGSGYSSDETIKVETCTKCYPYGYGKDHFCEYEYTGVSLNQHPHYAVKECKTCGKQWIDYDNTTTNIDCSVCENPFKNNVEKYTDFHGRIYDLSKGTIVASPKGVNPDELFDWAKEVHASLEVIGLIPVFGEVADLANAVYYIVEGNYVDAVLSGLAVVPVIGYVSVTGKIYKYSGKVVIDAATGTAKKASQKVIKEFIVENIDDLEEIAQNILKHSDDYSEKTLRIIKNISESKNLNVSDIFYNGELLILEYNPPSVMVVLKSLSFANKTSYDILKTD